MDWSNCFDREFFLLASADDTFASAFVAKQTTVSGDVASFWIISQLDGQVDGSHRRLRHSILVHDSHSSSITPSCIFESRRDDLVCTVNWHHWIWLDVWLLRGKHINGCFQLADDDVVPSSDIVGLYFAYEVEG